MFNGNTIFEKVALGDRLKEMVQIKRSGLLDHAWGHMGHSLRVNIEEENDGYIYDLIVDKYGFQKWNGMPL